MSSRRRVAVTGLGAVTPLGTGVERSWKAIVDGGSGAGPITRFDASDFSVRIACEVDDFDPLEFIDARDARRTDRFTQFAIASALQAAEQAGWSGLPYSPEQVGVVIGSGIGGIETLEAQHRVLLERGPSKMSPFTVPLLMLNAAAGAVAMRFGAHGVNYATASACATGAHAIGEAVRVIRSGEADAMIAGGSEAAVCPLGLGGFACLGALSRRNDEPQRASRPFDADRDGFVVAEGAAVLVLEDFEKAERRGATPLAELTGYGASCDGYHLTQPDPEGQGAISAMRRAIADADLEPGGIEYVNAHGTSTPYNDRVEAAALREVFGDSVPPVSSTKGATGHMLGAAGAVEALLSVMTLHTGLLPPTINHDTPDPECDLDIVPNAARREQADRALSNSFGFGGHNACLIFERVT